MSALTPEEKKRLAEEAEKLAMDCVEGRVRLDLGALTNGEKGAKFYGCAMGTIYHRAFGDTERFWSNKLPGETLVVRENNLATDADRCAAVVFPLLALRDALLEAP